MAQSNVEQYREEMALPFEHVDSSASSGNASSFDERWKGDENLRIRLKEGELREPPSSSVGYGGGEDTYVQTPNLMSQGYWEEKNDGATEYQSWPDGQDRRDSGPRGYYSEEGSNASSHASSISSEVRGGVPHRVMPDGAASGAGLSSGIGGATPPCDIEQHQYHLGEVTPSSQKATPYSQQLTQPDEGRRDHFQEDEGISGNTKGGTAEDHQKEAAASAKDGEEEGFLSKLMHRLPGQGHRELKDAPSDVKDVDSGAALDGDEDGKPGVVTAIKETVLPNHDKHPDEIDPEIFN